MAKPTQYCNQPPIKINKFIFLKKKQKPKQLRINICQDSQAWYYSWKCKLKQQMHIFQLSIYKNKSTIAFDAEKKKDVIEKPEQAFWPTLQL